MQIKPNDKVLEIGSGNNPRPRANILADRLIYNNSQRAGFFNAVIDRPTVVCDGYRLPFKDKSFDYVICSHVLEHLEDPKAFAKEIMRVGRRGYIEVPNIFGERLFGWDFHLWHCEMKNNTLVMTPKKEGERFGGFFHRLIANTIWFRRFFEKYENIFYIQHEWKGKIYIKIMKEIKPQKSLEKVDADIWNLMQKVIWSKKYDLKFYTNWMVRRIQRKIKKECRKLHWKFTKKYRKHSILVSLLGYLQCIHCNSEELVLNTDTYIICKKCSYTYKIDGIFPIMLTKKELKKGY